MVLECAKLKASLLKYVYLPLFFKFLLEWIYLSTDKNAYSAEEEKETMELIKFQMCIFLMKNLMNSLNEFSLAHSV